MKLWGKVGGLLAVIAFLVGGALLIHWSNANDARLNRIQDCVVASATAQHYAGNPYSEEAWNLFAGNCK